MNEEEEVLAFLRCSTTTALFDDDLHRRLVGAFNDPAASDLDRAVLVRQLLRRWSLRDGRDVPVDLATAFAASIRRVSDVAGLRERPDGMWRAEHWRPDWLTLDGGIPDAAALAGTLAGIRANADPVAADPFFRDITEFDTYKTPGQRAACRAVMTAPEGSTVISMLPTGSGKTEIALCLAERTKRGLTVILVPTVALAYDFERRFREHYGRPVVGRRKVDPMALNFAWTASTGESVRDRLKLAITNGQQRILVTSPESITRALRQTLLETAATGRLNGFVVDEAHLVTQWGRGFRPDFRTLADLRRDLLDNAETGGHARAVTLLLSATLGTAEMTDMTMLFSEPGPCSPVIANALRPEPDFWIADTVDADERARWVRDTIAHCARPAVLYVTRPEVAAQWLADLRAEGYSRVAVVTGHSSAVERAAVLEGIRANPDTIGAVDLVVATSAFGLGIDYPHIRSVVHACLPETVDRWYQELGRGGRDGHVCAAFLLTGPGDHREARSLGVKVLTPKKAEKRWYDLWDHRRSVNGRTFLDLEESWGPGRGDYNHGWNAQLIQGLVELGELRREQFDVDDLRDLLDADSVEVSDWTAVQRVAARLGVSTFWEETWLPWQQRESSRSAESLQRIRDVSQTSLGACYGIAAAYAPSEELRADWGHRVEFMEPSGGCGRCPHCRRRDLPVACNLPPAPEQVWAVGTANLSKLNSFASATRGSNGLALLSYDSGDGNEFAVALAAGLTRLGVGHVAGLASEFPHPPGSVIFSDGLPLSPVDLTPVSSFSHFTPEQTISRRWLARRTHPRLTLDGAGLVDILLVSAQSTIGGRAVGRDLPALPAVTAIELLQRS